MQTIPSALADSEAFRSIASGGMRKQFGLSVSDLGAGLELAKSMIDRGEPEEAMQIYLSLVLLDPTVLDFQIGLANCALLNELSPLALQAASAAVASNPSDPRGYLLSGRACMQLEAYKEAVEDFNDAAEKAEARGDLALAAQARVLGELAASQIAQD